MTTKTAKTIGDKLLEYREKNFLTTRYVAKETKIDHSVISRIERGENKISLENAIRLCEYYGYPLSRVSTLVVRNKAGRII